MSQPQPGQLNHCGSQSWIARFGHPLFAVDRSALPGRRRQSGVGRHLPAIGKGAVKSFRPYDRRVLRADPSQIAKDLRRSRRDVARLLDRRIPLALDGLQLRDDELEPIEFASNLSLDVVRQRAAVARLQSVQPRSAMTMERFIVEDALGEEKAFDAIDVFNPLGQQRLAFPADPTRRSSSSGVGGLTMAHTRGSPRL